MKYLIVILFLATTAYSQDLTYYKIYADVKEDVLFRKILEETNLQDIYTIKYQIVVKVGVKEPFVVIGGFNSPDVEWDIEAFRYDWGFFSKLVREGLTLYRNKIRIR